MYYVESIGAGPWASDVSGHAASDWRDLAKADLESHGLHPLSIDRVPANVAACASPGCPNGYALRVFFSPKERDAAAARCFVSTLEGARPSSDRTDCVPLDR